MIIPDKTH